MNQAFEAFDLSGRAAVISGASSAMGDSIATAFARAGARLVLGDLAEPGMQSTRQRLEAEGHEVVCRRSDVTMRSEVDALVEIALTRYGQVDVMANIAGIIHDSPVVDTEERDLDRVLAVNLKGVYFGCQAATRAMSQRGSGSIVNMASSGAFTAIPTLSCYSMSKAGVVALTRTLALEAGASGIRVNAVAPGYVEGGMSTRNARRPDGSLDEEAMERVRASARSHSPLHTLGMPNDIAHAFLFLASDASRYMTGQVLHANGGAHMP